jgi:hypothetical protein
MDQYDAATPATAAATARATPTAEQEAGQGNATSDRFDGGSSRTVDRAKEVGKLVQRLAGGLRAKADHEEGQAVESKDGGNNRWVEAWSGRLQV